MQITIDTSYGLSPADRLLLQTLLDSDSKPAISSNAPVVSIKTPPAKPAPTTDTTISESEPLDQALLDQATTRATKILKSMGLEDGTPVIQSALAKTGFERVTMIDSNEALKVFLDALPA